MDDLNIQKLIQNIKDHINDQSLGENQKRYEIGRLILSFYLNNKKEIKAFNQTNLRNLLFKHYSNYFSVNDLQQQKSNWNLIINVLSGYLNKRYKTTGYGVTNLNAMQQFYKKYRNNPALYSNAMKLEWSHNVELLKNRLDENERAFYLQKAITEDWTIKQLNNHIANDTYEEFNRLLDDSNFRFDINKVYIHNYKSLVDVNIQSPSGLTVLAGANASGKSNVFEAIDFLIHSYFTYGDVAFEIFGGKESLINFSSQNSNDSSMEISMNLLFGSEKEQHQVRVDILYEYEKNKLTKNFTGIPRLDDFILNSFSRYFIDNQKRAENKIKFHDKLWLDASNLNLILKEIFSNPTKRNEIIEWLQILVPGVENIEIERDITGKEELRIFEEDYPDKPFTGNLISEGTYNIIALLTIFFQSDKPQFICIEEPEIGLNPAILSEMVPFFREMHERYGHHIWVTTHSASLVSELEEDELIIVNKEKGQTKLNRCKKGDFEELRPDEAWLSKMLKGGGLPW
ncbi:MAG: AAA family ATPase [Bacteroidales bacterium]|nr:AAA family ATPase [Bacteroidales bacterium]MCF8338060.1 AAA family ATPase [Bacteroidales bacterium]